jgi:hypothetical protein
VNNAYHELLIQLLEMRKDILTLRREVQLLNKDVLGFHAAPQENARTGGIHD